MAITVAKNAAGTGFTITQTNSGDSTAIPVPPSGWSYSAGGSTISSTSSGGITLTGTNNGNAFLYTAQNGSNDATATRYESAKTTCDWSQGGSSVSAVLTLTPGGG